MAKEPLPLFPEFFTVASPAKRAAARLIDIAVVLTWVWALAISHVLFYIPYYAEDTSVGPWGHSFLFFASFVVLYLVYEVVFLTFTGVTPGKDVLNLRVVDHATLQPLSTYQAVKRALPIAALWLVPPFWWSAGVHAVLGLSTVTSPEHYQGWHDRLAQTRVVYYDATLAPGVDTEEARLEKMTDFMPRFTSPIQVLPSQMLNYPSSPIGFGKDAKDSSAFE